MNSTTRLHEDLDSPADPESESGRGTTPDGTSTVSRRSWLKTAALGGAGVLVAGTGGLGYRVFDQRVLDPDHGDAFDPWRHWRDTRGPMGLVAAAILAANPHNTQPWEFAITAGRIDVYADNRRLTGALDSLGREQHVGLGCAIENLVLAAAAAGLVAAVTLLPEGEASDHVAQVDLRPGLPARPALFDAIGDRHTNRGPYADRLVPTRLLAEIGAADGFADASVTWITDPAAKAGMGVLMTEAAVAITNDEVQSRDSFGWFRSTDDAIQQHRDGLTLDGQGLSPVMLTVAKLLPSSSRSSGDAFWVGQTRDVHTRTAAAYGVITVPDAAARAAQLVGGRLLQRAHLAATVRGVAMQHMNQVTERIDRERSTGVTPTFAPRLAALLPGGQQPLVAFRVGYANRSAKLSPRRSLDAVLR